MEKIAIATSKNILGNGIAGTNFRDWEGFTIYEVVRGIILKKEYISKSTKDQEYNDIIKFIKDININVLISGYIEEDFHQLLLENELNVLADVDGTCDDLIKRYIKGSLDPDKCNCGKPIEDCGCGSLGA